METAILLRTAATPLRHIAGDPAAPVLPVQPGRPLDRNDWHPPDSRKRRKPEAPRRPPPPAEDPRGHIDEYAGRH